MSKFQEKILIIRNRAHYADRNESWQLIADQHVRIFKNPTDQFHLVHF